MTNAERIRARIARDKARKAEKKYSRAHGTWRQEGAYNLEWASAAANAAARGEKTDFTYHRVTELNRLKSPEERLAAITPFGEFDRVFTLQNLIKSLQKRRKGVEWKGNVQRFLYHAVLALKRLKDGLRAGKLKVDDAIRLIVLHERGKRRIVHAVMIDCRVVQGCLCDSCLIPLTEYRLIRDNPASVKGRGVTDARKRLEMFLHELAKKCGNKFYMLTSDFQKFFDNLRHADVLRCLKETQADRMIQGLGMKITRMYQEGELDQITDPALRAQKAWELKRGLGVGLTLGSQESQIMALTIPTRLDHAVKELLSLRCYIRYMDDTASGAESKEKLKTVGRMIRAESTKIGLKLNPKKTAIAKASKGFKFLQIQYRVTDTGHLVKRLAREGIVRMRKKLVKFKKKVLLGQMSLDNVFDSFSAWFGNSFHACAYRTRKRMLNLYNRLFHRYKTEGIYA